MDGEAFTRAYVVWPPKPKGVHALTDAEGFISLVESQTRFVFRVAYAVLLNAHDAEDAVQETFMKLYRNGSWQRAKNLQAYLARAAWRVAVDIRRRSTSKSATSRLEPAAAAELNYYTASPQPGPEATLLAADWNATVHAAIDSLPEELRVPLVLSSFDELNSREIGTILGIPEGTVRTRLKRARQVLRRKLMGLEEARHA